MKMIQQAELRELQMQILDYIDEFCRENKIHYTISGGTLLGAVRHGGFIPWDDDMDIQMRRDEYIRFTKIWNENVNKHGYFEFLSIESGNSMEYPFGKVHDTRTVTYLGGYERTGVYIDVFPVDNVLDNDDFTVRHDKVRKIYKQRSARFVLQKSKYGHVSLFSKIKAILRFPLRSYDWYAFKINELAKIHYSKKTELMYEMIAGLRCKLPIPSEVFYHYKDITFENRHYMSVEDTHTYLMRTFGDYMKLPPKEQQVCHHGFDSYWKSNIDK